MKILVADDDEVVRAQIQRVAIHASHDVFHANSGAEALALIQRSDPDILITDLRLPDMDGFQLIDAVRAMPLHRRLPVICLSSVSDRDAVARMIEKGISDYVLKPVRPAELAKRIYVVAARERNWKRRTTPPPTPVVG